MRKNEPLIENLIWQIEAGIDECIVEKPQNRFIEPKEGIDLQKVEQTDNKLIQETIVHDEISRDQALSGKENSNRSLPKPPKSNNVPKIGIIVTIAVRDPLTVAIFPKSYKKSLEFL